MTLRLGDVHGIIAVDFDGTIAEHEYPRIGPAVPGAIETLRELAKTHDLILLTMRDGRTLDEAVAWCAERGVTFVAVNDNAPGADWSKSRKVYAHLYIDDAAAGCPLLRPDPTRRPFVDWAALDLLGPT